MTPKVGERVFDKKYAKTLLEIAVDDLASATVLGKSRLGRKETSIFLVQQAVEKALKAVLCHFECPVPLVHDLGALIARMPSNISPPHGYDLIKFNDFAGILRYEKGHTRINRKDVLGAIKTGKEVLMWAAKLIG